jgi:hypothetical protein
MAKTDSITMLPAPQALVSRKDILIGMHNSMLEALTKNEVKFKALTQLLESGENLDFEFRQQVEQGLGIITSSLTEQKLTLYFIREELASELDKEEKEIAGKS